MPAGEGIPANLIKIAEEEVNKLTRRAKKGNLASNELAEFDELWIVFDTDHASRQNQLDPGIEAANNKGFGIAHSTPCFEFWLALHFSEKAPPMNADEAHNRLKDINSELP